nr:acyl-CoA dehydrogenase [Anaerolineae bacterium]
KGAPPGVKGISLLICPKFLVNEDGSVGKRNDVRVAGLLHKMGYRNATSTVLNLGENGGAIGFLVGQPHQGLFYMFQMMNEARIGVGLGAASLAYQGFNYSLDYARQRPQGRLPSNKDPASRQVPIIEHADVRRMLLAQKAYAEGGLAMCLYASALFEDSRTAPTEDERHRAFLLLDLITPVIKSWPSKYGLKANDLAIQVLGGSGYIREYPVEQYYRDQRLNPIHEGTEAIHGLDILGRKVRIRDGAGYLVFKRAVEQTLEAAAKLSQTNELVAPLRNGITTLDEVTQVLVDEIDQDADLALANATVYLDLFGCIVAAWIWLQQAVVAANALAADCRLEDQYFYLGKLQTARYYFQWELPKIASQAALLKRLDRIPLDMQDTWFGP